MEIWFWHTSTKNFQYQTKALAVLSNIVTGAEVADLSDSALPKIQDICLITLQ